MRAFLDPETGLLKAYGNVEANVEGDVVLEVGDEFSREPGQWRYVAGEWLPAFNRDAAMQKLRDKRKPILDALAGIAGRLQRRGMEAEAEAADTAAQALLDIPKHPALEAASTEDEFSEAVMYLYRQAAAACPPIVQTAFVEAT